MYIVTNRNLQPRAKPTARFGKEFNENGPDELRLAEATKTAAGWQVRILGDTVRYKSKSMYASEQAFLKLQEHMRKQKRNCLLFVHGFNNDFKDVLERGWRLQETYDLEVIVFTWPADGRLTGATHYRSDKRDAVRSAPALDRTLEKLAGYFCKHEDQTLACRQRISLMMHSMGNYLFKNLMKSSIYHGETSIFDNVVLVAADVNNEGHAEWIDRVAYRRRLYVTINEDDKALRLSRLKVGDAQKARLGHFTQNLTAERAIYFDFTRALHVEDSHAYFEGKPLKNENVRRVFHEMFHGERAERDLEYNVHARTYQIP